MNDTIRERTKQEIDQLRNALPQDIATLVHGYVTEDPFDADDVDLPPPDRSSWISCRPLLLAALGR